MFNVEIQGLTQVLSKIEAYSKELADGLDEELSLAAENVANMARVRAPKGRSGQLAASITADIGQRFSKTVSVPVLYAPYVEFGTGLKVFKSPSFNFTPEMKAYAMEFYVSGLGKEPPLPYLFPSLEVEKVRLMTRIKQRFFGNRKL